MMLEKGKTYDFNVEGDIVTIDEKKFFKVRHSDSGESYMVGALPFQLKEPKPEKLRCLIKDVTNSGSYVITQDFAPHIARFYKEGEIYTFKIKQKWTQGIKTCYFVSDEYGFSFPLESDYSSDIHMYQDVQCRVLKLYKNYLQLSLEKVGRGAETEDEGESLSDQLLISVLPKEWESHWETFLDIFYLPDLPEFEEALFRWIDKVSDEDIESHIAQTDTFRVNCLNLLENSDQLWSMDYGCMLDMQRKLSICVENASYIYQGKTLISKNEHEVYVSQLLDKLEKSGYIYHPEEKLGILRTILRCTKGDMLSHVRKLVSILSEGTMNYWSQEPIRSSLVKLLDDQIRNHREAADFTATNGDGIVSLVLSLIVMEICLVEETGSWERDMVDKRKLYSMLYRYLSYMDNAPVEKLASKSISCLVDGVQSNGHVVWSDLSNFSVLAQKMANVESLKENNVEPSVMSYRTDHAQILVGYNGIEIVSVAGKDMSTPALPSELLPWNSQQIYVSEKVKGVSGLKSNLLDNYKKYWDSLQNVLMSQKKEEKVKSKAKKLMVDKGEEVMIRITGPINEHNMFPCTVEEDKFYGHGYIAASEIVDWNVYDTSNAFLDEEENPLLLRAKVTTVDANGDCFFTMKKFLKNHVVQCVGYGDELTMLVKSHKDSGYQGISNMGYPLHFDVSDEDELDADINIGDYVRVRVEDTNSNRSNISCSFLRHEMDAEWTEDDAFEQLMFSYSEGNSLKVEDEEEGKALDVESQLKPSYVMEIMLLEDRLSSLGEAHVAYSYLGMARALAALMSNVKLVDYYSKRMELLKMLHEFSLNGRVDSAQIESFKQSGSVALSKDSQLWFRYNQLLIISFMGEQERNGELWGFVSQKDSASLSALSSLVLSYNLTDGFSIERTREQIKEKIYTILNLKTRETIHHQFGPESPTVEHKTSIVFPPENGMRPDLKTQTYNVMKEVCAFMNAAGGTLYIGVNNEGTATGLENDLKQEFSNDKDKLNVYFRNELKSMLGMEANTLVETSFFEDEMDIVYVVKVSPSEKVIRLKGKVYERQDTSSEPLSGSYLKTFLKRKGSLDLLEEMQEVKPVAEVTQQEEKKNEAAFEKKDVIETNQLRGNVFLSWEEGFRDPIRCITFLGDGKYRLDEEVYDSEGLLTLAVHEDERAGYLVLAYKDGTVNVVPLREILEKKNKEVLRLPDGDLFFAGIAQVGDRLFCTIKGTNGMFYYRMDQLKDLNQGKVTDSGKMLNSLSEYEFVQVDIVSKSLSSIKEVSVKRDMGVSVTKAQGLELKRSLTAEGYKIKEV